jgi:outer membrane protein assembly factor BamB
MLAPTQSAASAMRLSLLFAAALAATASAANWSRFRGENGAGVSTDPAALPTQWDGTKNLKWSVDLPGPGSSSPIVVGDKVIVTCWTGDDAPDMVRHVLCFDRQTGKQLWDAPLEPVVQDEPYRGMFAQHGYASHTPVSDGEKIYCFFGVSGVYAFDMNGKKVWGPVSVGTGFDNRGWGSASSPILFKDKLIVTAGSESQTLYALDKNDGHEVWKQTADGLAGLWGTPAILQRADGLADIVLGVPGELWGVNPDSGKLRWYVTAGQGDSMCGSAIVADGVAYMLGERGGQMIAAKAGKGDVTDQVLWAKSYQGRISTPVAVDGLIYVPGNGSLTCVDAATGEQVYRERLAAPTSSNEPEGVSPGSTGNRASNGQSAAEGEGGPGGAATEGSRGGFGARGFGGRGRGGGRGGMMAQDYSSPIVADGKLYFVRRNGDAYVVQLGRQFKQLGVNRFGDDADFSASPAVSDGELFIRSSKKLYCIAKTE